MKRTLSIITILGLLSFGGTAIAQDDHGSVDCEIQITAIAITVLDGAIVFPDVAPGETTDTGSAGAADQQTISNTGTIDVSIDILGSDTNDWTLVPKASLGNLDEFGNQYKLNGIYTDLTTITAYTGEDILSGASAPMDMTVTAPTTVSTFGLQSWSVEITARQITP